MNQTLKLKTNLKGKLMSAQNPLELEGVIEIPEYELQPATTEKLGGIIVGDNLEINNEGILNALSSGGDLKRYNLSDFLSLLSESSQEEIYDIMTDKLILIKLINNNRNFTLSSSNIYASKVNLPTEDGGSFTLELNKNPSSLYSFSYNEKDLPNYINTPNYIKHETTSSSEIYRLYFDNIPLNSKGSFNVSSSYYQNNLFAGVEIVISISGSGVSYNITVGIKATSPFWYDGYTDPGVYVINSLFNGDLGFLFPSQGGDWTTKPYLPEFYILEG